MERGMENIFCANEMFLLRNTDSASSFNWRESLEN